MRRSPCVINTPFETENLSYWTGIHGIWHVGRCGRSRSPYTRSQGLEIVELLTRYLRPNFLCMLMGAACDSGSSGDGGGGGGGGGGGESNLGTTGRGLVLGQKTQQMLARQKARMSFGVTPPFQLSPKSQPEHAFLISEIQADYVFRKVMHQLIGVPSSSSPNNNNNNNNSSNSRGIGAHNKRAWPAGLYGSSPKNVIRRDLAIAETAPQPICGVGLQCADAAPYFIAGNVDGASACQLGCDDLTASCECDDNCGAHDCCGCDCSCDRGCCRSCNGCCWCDCGAACIDSCACDEAIPTASAGGTGCDDDCSGCTYSQCQCQEGLERRTSTLCCAPPPQFAIWNTNYTLDQAGGDCAWHCGPGLDRHPGPGSPRVVLNDTDQCCWKPANSSYVVNVTTCDWECNYGFEQNANLCCLSIPQHAVFVNTTSCRWRCELNHVQRPGEYLALCCPSLPENAAWTSEFGCETACFNEYDTFFTPEGIKVCTSNKPPPPPPPPGPGPNENIFHTIGYIVVTVSLKLI